MIPNKSIEGAWVLDQKKGKKWTTPPILIIHKNKVILFFHTKAVYKGTMDSTNMKINLSHIYQPLTKVDLIISFHNFDLNHIKITPTNLEGKKAFIQNFENQQESYIYPSKLEQENNLIEYSFKKPYKKRNNLQLKYLNLESGVCDECLPKKITINNDLLIINEMSTTDTLSFKLTLDENKTLNELIQFIDFDSLKNNYEAPWTDDQKIRLDITFKNQEKSIVNVYGYHQEPVQLRCLMLYVLFFF